MKLLVFFFRRRCSASQLLTAILMIGAALFSLQLAYTSGAMEIEAQIAVAEMEASTFALKSELRNLEPPNLLSLAVLFERNYSTHIPLKTTRIESEARISLSTASSTRDDISVALANSYDIMSQRALHVRQVCAGREVSLEGISKTDTAYERIEIGTDNVRKYLYCPILKIGSTFFNRALFSLRHTGKIVDPYHIPIMKALQDKRHVLTNLPLNQVDTHTFISDAMSFLFVREPYVRLLSGYMDKLFAPNPYFWKEIGLHIIAEYRPKTNSNNPVCGHDVSFSEFIQYVIDAEVKNGTGIAKYRDFHFTPAYDQCKVCKLNYTLIGKMESFSYDMGAIVQQLGSNVSQAKLSMWSKEATLDAISDTVKSPFGWKRYIKRCMSWHEALRRIWRKLQSRAIVPLEDEFPFPKESEGYITTNMFIAEAIKRNKAADKGRLKLQKKEVLAMAYGNLEPDLIRRLTEVFQPDFELFKYEDKPDFLYDKDFVDKYKGAPSLFNT